MLKYDLHIHTNYSHGKGTPEEIVLAAISRGLSRIAISEHAPGHVFYGVSYPRMKELRREIDRLNSVYGKDIEVLMGIECNLTGYGKCDLPEDDSIFDVKILAFHKGIIPKDGFGWARTLESLKIGGSAEEKTANALLEAADKYKIDIFSHPSLYVKSHIPTLAKGAAQLGVKLEINGARVTMTKEELRQSVAAGAQLIIGSDAHSPERVGDDSLALRAAEEAGVAEQVVNLV